MPRFGIRSLFGFIAVVAGFAFLSRNGDYLPAVIVAMAIAGIVWAVCSRKRGWWIAVRVGSLFVATPALWLAGLQGVWFFDTCPDCWWERDSLEYRVLGVPIWADRQVADKDITLALRDLGFGCDHRTSEIVIWQRHWGGCFCAFPCFNGTLSFYPRPFYTPEVSVRVKQIGWNDPSLAEELQQRVILDDDTDYFRDGFMLDQLVLGAYDAGRAIEARRWFAEAPVQVERELLERNREWVHEYIDDLYGLGVTEVIIYWAPERYPDSKPGDFDGAIALRLPREEPQRTRVTSALSAARIADGYSTNLIDYGQEFAREP